jgi:cytochrome P450
LLHVECLTGVHEVSGTPQPTLADPENVTQAVEETLRFDSPVNALTRTATSAGQLAADDLPKGAGPFARLVAGASIEEHFGAVRTSGGVNDSSSGLQ